MPRHYFFNAHGSLEQEQRYVKFELPAGVTFVTYTMPGAALAEEIADYVMDHLDEMMVNPEDFLLNLHLAAIGRETKGYGDRTPPSGFLSSPILTTGPEEIPNYTITGDEDLSASEICCLTAGRERVTYLREGDEETLVDYFATHALDDGDFIHWISCLSYHGKHMMTRSQSGPGGGNYYGFKSILET